MLTTSLTLTATAEVAEYLGARTRFLDVEPDTLNLDPIGVRHVLERDYRRVEGALRHRLTDGRLAAIVPVHFAGHPVDMDALLALSREFGVPLFDDAAHALPAAIGGQRIGAWGNPTAFSFYATKTLTTGEGGMFCTDDDGLASRVRLMSLHGISRTAWNRYTREGSWHYEVEEAGFKYNLTDLASALGRVQLRRLEEMRFRRVEIAERYAHAFAKHDGLRLPITRADVLHAWHLYPVRLRLEALRLDRAGFIEALRERGVGASVHFIPLHRQPFYRDRYAYDPSAFPVAEAEWPALVSLPIYSAMTEDQVGQVIEAVVDVLDVGAG